MKIVYEGDNKYINLIPDLVNYYLEYGIEYNWNCYQKAGTMTVKVGDRKVIGTPYMLKSGLKIKVWEQQLTEKGRIGCD